MANRVVMDSSGLKISKPGFNVLTTGVNNLLMDTTEKMVQVVQSGIVPVSSGGNWTTVTHPNIGFYPFIWFYTNGDPIREARLEHLSFSSFRITVDGGVGYSTTASYIMLNFSRDSTYG